MLFIGVIGCAPTTSQGPFNPDGFVFDASNLTEEVTTDGQTIYTLGSNRNLVITYSLGLAEGEVHPGLFVLKEIHGGFPGKKLTRFNGQPEVIQPRVISVTRTQVQLRGDNGELILLDSPPKPTVISPLDFALTTKHRVLDSVSFRVRTQLQPGHKYELTVESMKSVLGDIAPPLRLNFFANPQPEAPGLIQVSN